MRVPKGFHVEAARRPTSICPQQRTGGLWIHLKPKDVLRVARVWTIGDYFARRRHNIAKTIEGRSLLEERRGAERKRGSPCRQFWLEQEMMEEEGGEAVCGGGGRGIPPTLL